MEVLLDSSFIVSCVRQRIDFLSQLAEQGYKVKVPREVLQELKDLKFKCSPVDRAAINIALEMLNKKTVKKMKLGGRTVDDGLIDKGKEGYYIATLDTRIKNLVPKKIVIFSSKKSIGVG